MSLPTASPNLLKKDCNPEALKPHVSGLEPSGFGGSQAIAVPPEVGTSIPLESNVDSLIVHTINSILDCRTLGQTFPLHDLFAGNEVKTLL